MALTAAVAIGATQERGKEDNQPSPDFVTPSAMYGPTENFATPVTEDDNTPIVFESDNGTRFIIDGGAPAEDEGVSQES